MVKASKFVYFIQIEDIDINGFLADALDIKIIPTEGFYIERVLPLNKITYEKLIISHLITDADKCFLWNEMKSKPSEEKPYNRIKNWEARTQRRIRRK